MPILRMRLRSALAVSIVVLASLILTGCESAEQRAQSHYERGLEFIAEGELVKASLELRNALKLKDDMVPAIYSLATVERQRGNLEGAVGLLVNVTERDPKHIDARIDLATILSVAGQLDDALKFADQAYAIAAKDPRVLALKAGIALRLDNRGDALRLAQEALAIDPKNVNALMVRAAERLLANDAPGALPFLDAAQEIDERDVGVQLFRIRVLEALDDRQGIEDVLVKLAALYPDNASFRDGLARWYVSAGRPDDAGRVLREFAAKRPEDAQAALNVVAFLRDQNGPAAAEAELQALIEKGDGEVFHYQLALAGLLFGEDKFDQASDLLIGIINESPNAENRAAARNQLARMMAAKNDLAGAAEQANAVLADDAKNVDALVVRATVSVANGETAAAIEDLLAALNEAPQSSAVLQLLAEAYERTGAVELAEEQFAKALRTQPSDSAVGLRYVEFLLRYGKTDQSERLLTELRANAPTNRQVLTLLARLKLGKQDWLGAQEIADALRLLDDSDDKTVADQILAAALGGQQRYDESIRILQDVVAAAPGEQPPIASLVQAYVRAGKADTAETFVRSLIESDPRNAQAHILLGALQLLNQRQAEAETSYKTAIAADPNGIAGYRALAELYSQAGRFEDAEKTAREALAKQPDSGVLRLLLAIVLERAGKFDAAIAEYEEMFAREPRSAIVANNLASLLSDHRTDQASIDRAFEIASRFRNSEVPYFLDTLGWIYYLRGDFGEAVKLLKTSAERLPQIAAVQYHVGMAFAGLGQNDLALSSLEKAVDLAPADDAAQRDRALAAIDQLKAAPAKAEGTGQ